ncbi:tetratricopeptide repeat-containing sensor histidine kinase [Mucilaginibacter paludis]|uniref:histidine kinase n=1 Tax=Mucilaginibacter paludis DSM 18603 TaxID=714943 RepID=H1YC04_9SPHI|nr:tetratricopeptide repeat protein [Mucilaginibacter paludis]EHQ27082.1 signal transduction histidine kinase [Mucilaginibacter paludis DSM 18603]
MRTIKSGISLFLYIILLLKYHSSYAETHSESTDSLLAKALKLYSKNPDAGITRIRRIYLFAKKKDDRTAEIKSATLMARLYWSGGQYDSAGLYINYSLQLTEKFNIDSLMGDSWMIAGLIDHSTARYQQAIQKYKSSALYYQKEHKLTSMATSYLNIGMCQIQLSQYDNAIRYCLLAARLFEGAGDKANLANAYKTIASCFSSLGEFPKAILYNKKALSIRLKLSDKRLIAQSLNNTGNAFRQYHQPDSGIAYLLKCLYLRKNEKDSSILVLTLQNLGSAYQMKGSMNVAERYLLRSLNIAEKYNMQEEVARGDLDLAALYLPERKFKQGLAAAQITEKTAKTLNIPQLLMDAYAMKSNLYTTQNDYKNALLYVNLKNSIKDTIFNSAKNKIISELEIKYQTVQKEKDIAALSTQNRLGDKIVLQQKRLIIIFIAASLFLLILSAAAYNSYHLKNKANQRVQTLMRELHHRVKNNLQILSGLFTMQIGELNDESIRNALRENELRLTSMNLVHNKLYQDHNNTQIAMKEYLGSLLLHIKESFGKGADIALKVDVENIELEADKAVALGLIVNELATNAFKYAFDGNAGELYLCLGLQGKSKLLFQLSDNGKGIHHNSSAKNTSFGLKLVNLMARQLDTSLTVQNMNGTSYQMEIPV